MLDSVELADGLPNLRTLPAALRDSGYQTWHVGKWHLGGRDAHPLNRGFDRCFGGSHAGRPNRYYPPYLTTGLPPGGGREHLTDRLTREAVRFIDERNRERPFFLNLWHYAVHTPIHAPGHLIAKYVARRRDLGMDPSVSGTDDIETGGELGFGRLRYATLMRRRRQGDPAYAAMIEHLDASIGRLLDELAERNLLEETALVFTSDNGGLSSDPVFVPPTSNAPCAEGKGWTSDGGIRVPFIVRWPGLAKPGAIVDAPVIGMDVMPTILAMAGAPPEPSAHRDGIDLTPLLQGRPEPAANARPLFWHYPHYHIGGGRPACAVRSGSWKLIRHFESRHRSLYNLDEDPSESLDIAHQHPERVAELDSLLVHWLTETGAAIPTANPDWADWNEPARTAARWGGRALTAGSKRCHDLWTRARASLGASASDRARTP